MKALFTILLLAILIGGGVYIYLHRQELGLAGPTITVSEESAPANKNGGNASPSALSNWQKIDRPADGFSVEMPGSVKELQVPAYNGRGGTEPVNMILSSPGDASSFSVAWADNPPVARVNRDSPDKTMDMARDDALARTQSTLLDESNTSYQGFPAREFTGRNTEGGVLSSRLIYAGQRLYMLTAAFPSANARRDQDVTRFFNSFAINSSGPHS